MKLNYNDDDQNDTYEDTSTGKSNAKMPLIPMCATCMYCIILEKYIGLISEK